MTSGRYGGRRGRHRLEQIDRKVLQLFALVGESVSGATHALLSGDREAAKALADRDEVVDTLYHDIEQLTLQQLTVAGITSPEDLRFLVTVIRMLPDLERNGDLAEHVARRAARGLGAELSARSRGLVERMGEVAIHMWRATTDAYAERLPMGVSLVDTFDDEMDDLHVSLTVEVVAGTMPLPVAVELAMVARFYERFGDHAVNLAKRVAVLVPHHPGQLSDPRSRKPLGGGQATTPRATRASAICTALSAAPLRRLSPLTNRARRRPEASAARTRPTREGPVRPTCRGVGTSESSTPGAPASISTACSGLSARSNWATMDSEWPVNTGTRTQVQVTSRSGMARIFRLSSRNFCSSVVSPRAVPAPASRPWAARCGR